jgi:hypothetical protein
MAEVFSGRMTVLERQRGITAQTVSLRTQLGAQTGARQWTQWWRPPPDLRSRDAGQLVGECSMSSQFKGTAAMRRQLACARKRQVRSAAGAGFASIAAVAGIGATRG